MRLSIISFTQAGNRVNERLVKRFRELGETCSGYVLERFLNPCHEEAGLAPLTESLGAWTGKQFESRDGIIFVGAAGIAVRAIAPFLKDKMTDPAVVVVDERGRFAISLLSGHVGGANELTGLVAEILGAVPVITTATDVNGRFAVDVFARERGLFISDREVAKEISADVLDGAPVGFFSDVPVEGTLPYGFTQKEVCRRAVWITWKRQVEDTSFMNMFLAEGTRVLRLVPKVLSVGIGCRKGIAAETVEKAVLQVFEEYQLDVHAVAGVASVDLKKEEPGILAFCGKWNVSFATCDAVELEQVPGEFSESEFVRETTGTGSVCERAAVWDAMRQECAERNGIAGTEEAAEQVNVAGVKENVGIAAAVTFCNAGRKVYTSPAPLLVKKQVHDGVTVAVALRSMKIRMR